MDLNRRWRSLRTALGVAAACSLLAACVATAGAKEPPVSGVWSVRGPTNTIFLAGSIHLLKPDNSALPAALQRAYAEAERLVLELDLDDIDQMRMAAEMMQAGMRPGGAGLLATLPAEDRKRLSAAAERLGLPVAIFDTLEPWLAALMLTSADLVKKGYSAEAGIDQQLATRAKRDGKRVDGLETPAQQFAVFDRLPEAEQQHLLAATLDEIEDSGADLAAIEAAWRRGDQRQLLDLLDEDIERFPALEAALLTDRNRKWLPAIEAMLTGRDDVLIVVGAAHLLGDNGVVALLRKAGRKVEPLTAN